MKIGDVTRGEYIRNKILIVSSWRVSDMFEVSPCPSVTHGTVMILVLSLCNKQKAAKVIENVNFV